MAVSKVIYGGKTLIDLTGDTVDPGNLLVGVRAHDKQGNPVIGECTYDADTSGATAKASEILSGKTAYVKGNKISGSMANRGGVSYVIDDVHEVLNISAGYYDGSGTIGIDSAEEAKFLPSNIRQGVVLLGVEGTMTGNEDVNAQTKSVAPATTEKTYVPDSGYTHFTQFTVSAIPYKETTDASGCTTVTIG